MIKCYYNRSKLYEPFAVGSISHERNLLKREEQRTSEKSGPGAHNIGSGNLSDHVYDKSRLISYSKL